MCGWCDGDVEVLVPVIENVVKSIDLDAPDGGRSGADCSTETRRSGGCILLSRPSAIIDCDGYNRFRWNST
jgi:hypothetical protein